MQNIGDRLAEARKRLGIALREASEATKIRTDYLQSMETGSFDFSLPEIYKVGFLKIYARYLKLDADKLASDYLAQFGGKTAGDRENLGRIDAPGGLAPAHGAAGRDAPADYMAARAQNQAGLWRLAGFLGVAFVVLMLIVFGVQHLFNWRRHSRDQQRCGSGHHHGKRAAGPGTCATRADDSRHSAGSGKPTGYVCRQRRHYHFGSPASVRPTSAFHRSAKKRQDRDRDLPRGG